ncbi:Peroxisomal targeting signal 2 receptor [Neolecta irregularis DAH-3]|uniref:Peroxin-7 n=1 Tax=Neolecta irregularis (strain DAH-3) TaxID=1198029 RepID=A0A1U7LW06_NEOID|nr:Peroxisomal targeting signal 2 receptor [Neolecta irregularis DAH-3]|eukprot:OLL26866.1 Peroxisomal targeting signal 2 receptor [Neolecta irregularis DAH-3]
MLQKSTLFQIPQFNHSAIQFSPFLPDIIGLSSGTNFNLIGNGRLHILRIGTQRQLQIVTVFDTQDTLFTLAFSECHENHLVTGGGDGSIRLWDISLKDHPVNIFKAHNREVFSVNWNLISKQTFISSSWDTTIKLWDPIHQNAMQTYLGHQGCVYEAKFSPRTDTEFSSCSSDGTVKIWDVRIPHPSHSFQVTPSEILSIDYDRYSGEIITGSTDKTLRYFDPRNLSKPRIETAIGGYAIRKVSCSPWRQGEVMSSGYDMCVRLWQDGKQVSQMDEHREFVMGCDWSLWKQGFVGSASWDETIRIWEW